MNKYCYDPQNERIVDNTNDVRAIENHNNYNVRTIENRAMYNDRDELE